MQIIFWGFGRWVFPPKIWTYPHRWDPRGKLFRGFVLGPLELRIWESVWKWRLGNTEYADR